MTKLKKVKNSKKVTAKELESIQTMVQAINETQMNIGGLEFQKTLMLNQMGAQRDALSAFQKTLKDKYGDVTVNLADGSLKTLPKNESN